MKKLILLFSLILVFTTAGLAKREAESTDSAGNAQVSLSDLSRADREPLYPIKADTRPQETQNPMFELVGILCLVSLVAFFTYQQWLERRKIDASLKKLPGFLTILDSHYLGWGQRVYLLQNRQESFLLSQSIFGLRLIAQTNNLIPPDTWLEAQKPQTQMDDFLSRLRDQEPLQNNLRKSINQMDFRPEEMNRGFSPIIQEEEEVQEPINQMNFRSEGMNRDFSPIIQEEEEVQIQEAQPDRWRPFAQKPNLNWKSSQLNQIKSSPQILGEDKPSKSRNYLRLGGNLFKKDETIKPEVLPNASFSAVPKGDKGEDHRPNSTNSTFSRKISIIE